MRERWLVVAVAVLMLAAAPASAGNVTLVSEHTTFGTGGGEPAPSQLSGMSVSGSGDSASVVYDSGASSAGTNVESSTSRRDTANEAGVVINPNQHIEELIVGTDFQSGATQINVRSTSGALLGSGSISAFSSTSAATITGLNLEPGTDYRITAGDAGAVYQLTSNNDNLPTTSSTFDIVAGYEEGDGEDSSTVYNIDVISAESPASGEYVSATHDAADVTEGYVNITSLSNADVTSTWQYYDGSSWVDASTTTYSTTGNKSVSLSGNSDQWRVRVTPQRNSVDASATIASEGVLADSATPTLSNPDPTGSIDTYDGDISISVNDSDFGTPQGDSITVEANDSGGTIGSTTLASNGTATLPYAADSGTNNITWTAIDGAGNQQTLDQSFDAPSQLVLKNVSDQTQISSSANATVQLYRQDNDTVITRSASQGSISLGGLPAAATYVVRVDADGYRTRRTLLQDVFQQQSVYLLPNSANSHVVEFAIEDRTGTYDDSAELQVLRAINTSQTASDETEYQIVAGDRIGSQQQVKVELEDGVRYRIRISSPDGTQVRTLGAFVPRSDRVVNLQIGQLRFRVADGPQTYNISSQTIENGTGAVTDVRFSYSDPADATERIDISVQTRNGTVLGNDTQLGALGNYSFVQPVPSQYANNTSFVVKYEIVRNGEAITGQSRPGLNRYRPGVPLAPGLKQLFSVGFLLVVGGLFSSQNARVGAVITPLFAGGLWYFDWLPPETSVLAIALALGVGVLVNFADRRP